MKTLKAHVKSGTLRYVIIGCGTKRPRRMYTDEDIAEFIRHQTRRDVTCLCTDRKARRSITSISKSEVIAFTALRSERTAGKPRA